jgi:hypothetical protein
MSATMNVFISYKMPKGDDAASDKIDIAEEFAKELSDYSAGRVIVHYAANFAAGIDWRNELISTIKKCDMFILLYTGAEQQWEFCLLEAGLFQATYPNRPLVVLHDPATTRPAALAQLNSVKVTVQHLIDFLSPIFYEEPWSISPTLSHERLTSIATDLVRIFHSESATATNFDLVPSFVLEMNATEMTRADLRSGRIPDNSKLKGNQNWQMLFDKGPATQSLKWDDLSNWPVKRFYDLKFSRMALTALSKDTPGGCFIRPSAQEQGGGILFRITLRRYEEYASETGWRFYFTAAPIDIPIFGIGDTTDNDETRTYHLLNVCWYTRRRLIMILQDRAEAFASSVTATAKQRNALVDEIKDEIANINIQSFIRRIDHPRTLGDLLPLEEIRNDQMEWVQNTDLIDNYKSDSTEDFQNVVKALRAMKMMNSKYYAASSSGFMSAVTKELSRQDCK